MFFGFFSDYSVFIKIMENHYKCVLPSFVCPWQETFADVGDGDVGGGTNRGQYLYHHPIEYDIIEALIFIYVTHTKLYSFIFTYITIYIYMYIYIHR